MQHPILVEMSSKTHMKNVLAEAEHRRLVQAAQAASKSRQPVRQCLPKTSVLRKLVTSLGYSA